METKSSAHELSPSHAAVLILSICSISAVFIYLVYSKNILFGSEAGKWVYPYFDSINSIPFWIPAAVLGLTGLFIFLGDRFVQKYEIAVLAGGLIAAVLIQALLQQLYPYPMDQIIKSKDANSFYTPAIKYSAIQVLSQFQSLAKTFPPHASTNMPGKILLYQFMAVFTSSRQMMGYFIILISSLGGPLLYGICKRLFQDRQAALYAFVLYTLMPGKQVYLPILNTVTPLFILLCLYLLLVYLDSKNKLFLILLGLSLYMLALFEPSPFVTGFLFVAIILQRFGQKQLSGKELWLIAALTSLAFLAAYLFFVLFFSFNLWLTFQYILKDAVGFNAEADRGYLVWLPENAKEFFYAAGLPVMLVFIYLVTGLFRQWKTNLSGLFKITMENMVILSLLLTFCIVLLLGINRGEITRLWIYLAVFFQIPAALYMAKTVRSNWLFFIFAGTLLIQSIIELQRVGFIIPF